MNLQLSPFRPHEQWCKRNFACGRFSASLLGLGCTALLLLAGCATAGKLGQAKTLPAQLVNVRGDVRWASNVGMPWQEAKVSTPLPEGASIETGPNSKVC